MAKKTKTKLILALRPGRREMGIAVLEGEELIDWGITGFRKSDPDAILSQVKSRLTAIIQLYQIQTIAMEQPGKFRCKNSPMLSSITAQIRRLAQASDAALRAYDPIAARKQLCGSGRATHTRLAEYLVSLYPHLERYQKTSSEWKTAYWQPMFTAIGVGLVCARDLSSLSPIPRGAECATTIARNREGGRSSS